MLQITAFLNLAQMANYLISSEKNRVSVPFPLSSCLELQRERLGSQQPTPFYVLIQIDRRQGAHEIPHLAAMVVMHLNLSVASLTNRDVGKDVA